MTRANRRLSPRVSLNRPARLWGVDVEGRTFKEDAVLDNISSGGLYLRLTTPVQKGAHVYVAVRLADEPELPSLRLVASGAVNRTDDQPDGTHGVAVVFSRRRVL